MAISLGTNAIVGVRKEGTVNTEIQVIDKVPFTSCTLNTDPEYVEDESLTGSAGYNGTRIDYKPVSVSLECLMVDTVLDTETEPEHVSSDLLLHFANVDQGVTFGTGSLYSADSFSDTTFTLAITQGQDSGDPSVWAVTGCKVNSMTLSCDAGGALTGSFEILGMGFTNDSSVNTSAIMEALAGDALTAKPYIFSDMAFWFDNKANVLAGADAEKISGFSLSINNNLAQFHEAGSQSPTQATMNGFREVTLDFSYPQLDSTKSIWGTAGENAMALAMLEGAEYDADATKGQCEILFTQGSNSMWVGIPSLQITKAGSMVSGSGVLTEDVSCTAYRPTSATEMTTSVASAVANDIIQFETKNARTEVFQ